MRWNKPVSSTIVLTVKQLTASTSSTRETDSLTGPYAFCLDGNLAAGVWITVWIPATACELRGGKTVTHV